MDIKNGLIFDLRDLPEAGILLRGEVTFAELDIADEERLVFPWPARYDLHMSAVGTDVFLRGRIDFTLRGQCDRCEEWADHPFAATDVCHCYESPFGKLLDLTEDVREDILLAFPQRFLCVESCPGFCLSCGQNLKTGCCGCAVAGAEEAEAEEAEERPDPWSGLDGFKPVP